MGLKALFAGWDAVVTHFLKLFLVLCLGFYLWGQVSPYYHAYQEAKEKQAEAARMAEIRKQWEETAKLHEEKTAKEKMFVCADGVIRTNCGTMGLYQGGPLPKNR